MYGMSKTDLSSVHVQVLAVCIIQWERIRGCRSSIFLFLFLLLAVVCSLVPLRAKIQLALEEVREMTLTQTPSLGHTAQSTRPKPHSAETVTSTLGFLAPPSPSWFPLL